MRFENDEGNVYLVGMNHGINVIIILLVAVTVLGCGRREVARLDDIESYIQARPDSALAELRALDPASLRSARARATHSLLLAVALDKNYIDVASDSLAGPALEYFKKHGPAEREMLSWYYLGTAQYYSEDYSSSALSLEQARTLAEQLGSERYQGLSCMMMGYVYSRNYLLHDALESTRKSILHFAAIPDSFQVRRAECTLAERYLQLSRFHEADSLFGQVILAAPDDSFNVRKALPGQAVAVYYDDTLSGASRAVQLFSRAIGTYHTTLTPYYADYYGRALCDSGFEKEAEMILAQLESSGSGRGRAPFLKHHIAIRRNDPPLISSTSQRIIALQDSVSRVALEQSVLHSQRDYLDQANSFLVREAAAQKRIRWLLAAVIILLLAVLVMIVHAMLRRERLRENKLVELAEQARLMSSEMDKVRQQYVSAYKGQFQKITRLVELYFKTSGSKEGRDKVYKEVMNLSTTVGRDQRTYASLERSVNQHLDDAMSIYRQSFPDKDEDHYRLVCYFMAGYPASMIEMLTGLSQSAVYTRKHRLLKTLADHPSENTELLLRSLR